MQFVVHLDDPTVAGLEIDPPLFARCAAVVCDDVAAGSTIMPRAGDRPAVCAVAFERYVTRSAPPVPVIDDECYTDDQEVSR
jgi:hypothetical protein